MPILERMTWQNGALLVVDLQEKLIPRIQEKETVIANSARLIRAAQELKLPVWATEQYPKGLGTTIPEIAQLVPRRPDKTCFHCCAIPEIVEQLYARKIRHVTLAGIEAHVCVAQTALELLGLGYRVQVPADAVGSRHRIDWEFALRRLEQAGAVISTTEAALFEWVESADNPHFKAISALVKSRDQQAE